MACCAERTCQKCPRNDSITMISRLVHTTQRIIYVRHLSFSDGTFSPASVELLKCTSKVFQSASHVPNKCSFYFSCVWCIVQGSHKAPFIVARIYSSHGTDAGRHLGLFGTKFHGVMETWRHTLGLYKQQIIESNGNNRPENISTQMV